GIVESFACGTPVVGPDWIIPCREILEGSKGGRAIAKDAHAFARAALEVIKLNMNRASIADSVRDHYGNRHVATRFLETLMPIVGYKNRYRERLRKINWKV